MPIKPPLKYPGSKWSYANWICSHMPPHRIYLELFFGGGAVFFCKTPAKYETINDADKLVVNFFEVCRDHPYELAEKVWLTPFARDEYENIREPVAGKPIQLTGDNIEDARRFLVRCNQSFGSKLADRCGWKNTKKSTGPVCPVIWDNIPNIIREVAQRLKNAQIENRDAVELIQAYNTPDCLVYADPPYLGITRSARIYAHEMMEASAHIRLLEALLQHQGPVILSGYDNDLYNGYLKDWGKSYCVGRTNSGSKATEVIWMNFEPQLSLWRPHGEDITT